jgi:hypothetical protein
VTRKRSVEQQIIPREVIERRIYLVREHKVMLDSDLAALYEVPTKRLNEAVRRNPGRFPADFMFQLTRKEVRDFRLHIGLSDLRSQIATSSHGGRRYLPYVFTEQGVAMLSSVLNTDRAIAVNIAIIRTFARLRHLLTSHKELAAKLEALETKCDREFKVIFDVLRDLMQPARRARPQIGLASGSRAR